MRNIIIRIRIRIINSLPYRFDVDAPGNGRSSAIQIDHRIKVSNHNRHNNSKEFRKPHNIWIREGTLSWNILKNVFPLFTPITPILNFFASLIILCSFLEIYFYLLFCHFSESLIFSKTLKKDLCFLWANCTIGYTA